MSLYTVTKEGKCWNRNHVNHVMRKPSMWFHNRFNTNRAVQAQKMVRGWKFWILESRGSCTIRIGKTKALISFAVTVKLICAFVFAYADCWFSHDAAHVFEVSC